MCHVTTAGDPLPDDVMVVSSPEELLQELELSFDSSFNRGYVRDSLGKRRCLLQKHDCQLLVAEDQIDWLRSHKGERRSVCETILLQGHVTTDDAGTLPRIALNWCQKQSVSRNALPLANLNKLFHSYQHAVRNSPRSTSMQLSPVEIAHTDRVQRATGGP